jgi:hypothetical protein
MRKKPPQATEDGCLLVADQAPQPGAYVTRIRDDDPDVFDWSIKQEFNDNGKTPPNDQQNFVDHEIKPLIAQIIKYESELGPKYRKSLLTEARYIFERGAGNNLAEPLAATSDLQGLNERFLDYLSKSQKKKWLISLFFSLLFGVFILLVAIFFFVSGYFGQYASLTASLFSVAGASLCADALTLSLLKQAESALDYEKKKSLLDLPIVRSISTVLLAEIFAILAWKGQIPIKLGSLEMAKFDSDPWVGVVTGIVTGLLGSDLMKILIGYSRRAAGHIPNETGRIN